MNVIEFAEKRLQEEIHQNDLGANNDYAIDYWRRMKRRRVRK